MRFFKGCFACLLAATALTGTSCSERKAAHDPYNFEGPAPHLMAHYLPWFEDGKTQEAEARPTFPWFRKARVDSKTKPWEHWSWSCPTVKHNPETLRADGLRDIASAHYPLIGPYSTGDRSVIRYHCQLAKASGIEGWIVLWYGPGTTTDTRIPLILEESARAGLKVAICYEEKANWPPYRKPANREEILATASADLGYLLKKIAVHSAYLRRNGVPVVFQFNYFGADRLGPRTFTPEDWQTILATLPEKVCYVRQEFDSSYHPPLAGCYTWCNPNAEAVARHQDKAAKAIANGKLVFHVGMVSPGFDDIGTDGWGAGRRQHPRNGLASLQQTLSTALRADPELVQIVTWNDFNEGTEVEPTVENGFSDLDAIEAWWCGVKGVTPNPEAKREALKRWLDQCQPTKRQEVPEAAFSETKTSR
jgi:hypothetical protein